MNKPGKYTVIYADPPWHYRVWSKKGAGRSAESHYSTMSLEEIKALPVHLLAARDCALFLWITFPLLLQRKWAIEKSLLTHSIQKMVPVFVQRNGNVLD